jgi:hypothetical protein
VFLCPVELGPPTPVRVQSGAHWQPWKEMAKTNGDEPTQATRAGDEIPVPTRQDVLRDLEKLARAAASTKESALQVILGGVSNSPSDHGRLTLAIWEI